MIEYYNKLPQEIKDLILVEIFSILLIMFLSIYAGEQIDLVLIYIEKYAKVVIDWILILIDNFNNYWHVIIPITALIIVYDFSSLIIGKVMGVLKQ